MSSPVCPMCGGVHGTACPTPNSRPALSGTVSPYMPGTTANPAPPGPYQYQDTGGHKPEEGWINRQVERVARESQTWPEWMRREAETGDTWTPRDTHNAELEAAGGADLQLARAVKHIKRLEAEISQWRAMAENAGCDSPESVANDIAGARYEIAAQAARIAELEAERAPLDKLRDEVFILRARIAQLEAAQQCRPIAEAPPPQCKWLIGHTPDRWFRGFWSGHFWFDEANVIVPDVTHWRDDLPAPEPPKEAS